MSREEYAVDRMRAMLRMERLSEKWLAERDTPLQRLVFESAHYHIDAREKRFGISRNDQRVVAVSV